MPVRRILRVPRRYFRVATRRFDRFVAPARREWRRSLQLRVVALTLVASSLLVGAFGWFVADRSAKILLGRAQDEVRSSMNSKVDYAEQQLTVIQKTDDPKLPLSMNTAVSQLVDGNPTESGGSILSMRATNYRGLRPVTLPDVPTSDLITPELIATVAGSGRADDHG